MYKCYIVFIYDFENDNEISIPYIGKVYSTAGLAFEEAEKQADILRNSDIARPVSILNTVLKSTTYEELTKQCDELTETDLYCGVLECIIE